MNFRTTLLIAGACATPALTAQAQPAEDSSSVWTLQDENASVSAARLEDRFYVNGLRLGWASPTTAVPDFLGDLGHTLWGAGQQRVAFDLTQRIYTPALTNSTVPSPYDRPYAGVLLGNFSLLNDSEDTRSVLTLSLGLVGPGAGGEGVQNGFHDGIGQKHILGWGGQIQNTPAWKPTRFRH